MSGALTRWTAHERVDLMDYAYRAGALRAALRTVLSPPDGMDHIMRRGAQDLLAEIEAAESLKGGQPQ